MLGQSRPRLLAGLVGTAVFVLALLAFAFAGSPVARADDKPDSGAQAATADAVSLNGAPLQITVRPSGSYSVLRNGQQQFYGQYAEGVYLWVNGVVYGPERVPAGNDVNAYTQVSNTLSGNGSTSSPWVVTTVLNVPNTNLQLTQKVTYYNGAEFLSSDWTVCRQVEAANGASPQIHLFHAADLYTGGNDAGYGYYDAATGAIGGYSADRSLYQIFVPATPATNYMEDGYSTIWSRIGSTSGPGGGFTNTYRPNDLIDNGAGLEWVFDLTSGCHGISDFQSFSGTPVIPTPGTPGIPTPTSTPVAEREKPAHVWSSLQQDGDNSLAPGTVFTYSLHLNNQGPGDAHDTYARIDFDPSVQVMDFHSTESEIFVTEVTTHSINIAFHTLGNTESQWAYVIAKVRDDAVAGTALPARAYVAWEDTGSPKRWSNEVLATVGATADSGRHGLLRSLLVSTADPVAAGTPVGFGANFFGSQEEVSFWVNLPDGTVASINSVGRADDNGVLVLALNTSGLAPGTYSLVAHGLHSGQEGIGVFTIQ